ncbi:MAG: oligopeptide/dipeptide ABC transporter ATP-binding protein [Halolamina sp.]
MSTGDLSLSPDAETGEPLLEVRNLKKYYDAGNLFGPDPVKAVDGVSFDIRKGETLGLVGESGCGKTTLGRTILNLETATEGAVTADGTDVTSLSGDQLRKWQRNAQMVFQDPDSSLNDRMTVGELVREPMDAHDYMEPGARRQRVFDLLEQVGLQEEHYYRYPHQFSGGQRQRVGIARALALEPEFVVLDEPVSALDVSVQARIINLLEDLQAELELTYLFIAHDLSVVRHIADRVAVMYLGNVVELGDTEDVYTDPAHPYTVSLLSAIPGSTGSDRDRITLRGTPPNPRDPPAGCSFATRCPAKVRPAEYDLPGHAWEGIDELYAVFRAREQEETGGLLEGLKRRLGADPEDDLREVLVDTFDAKRAGAGAGDGPRTNGDAPGADSAADSSLREQVTLPMSDDASAVVFDAVDRARRGDDAAAMELLRTEFGSVCDETEPEPREVGDGRRSRCVRHDDGYDEPAPVIAKRSD